MGLSFHVRLELPLGVLPDWHVSWIRQYISDNPSLICTAHLIRIAHRAVHLRQLQLHLYCPIGMLPGSGSTSRIIPDHLYCPIGMFPGSGSTSQTIATSFVLPEWHVSWIRQYISNNPNLICTAHLIRITYRAVQIDRNPCPDYCPNALDFELAVMKGVKSHFYYCQNCYDLELAVTKG